MNEFFDIELIDINENVANFKFHKISKEDLDRIVSILSGYIDSRIFGFSSLEGNAVLDTKFFRGLLYIPYIEPVKTIKQENEEESVKISEVNLKKKVISIKEEKNDGKN